MYSPSFMSKAMNIPSKAMIAKRYREIRLARKDYVIVKEQYSSGKTYYHLAVKENFGKHILSLAQELVDDFGHHQDNQRREHIDCKHLRPHIQKAVDFGLSAEDGNMMLFRFTTPKSGTVLLPSDQYGLKFRVIFWEDTNSHFPKEGVSITGLESIENDLVLQQEIADDEKPRCEFI